MNVLRYIATFLGVILKELLPGLLAEYRKPSETKYVGSDPAANDAIGKSIGEQASRTIRHKGYRDGEK
jgi:hypothetical protein